MFRYFNSAWIVAAVLFSHFPSYATSREFADTSEIFRKYHNAVVTVNADGSNGTGFSIDPREYIVQGTEKTVRLVITAFHVVQGAQSVRVFIYKKKKDNGEWEYDVCRAEVYGLDIKRDVAVLAIPCNPCICKRLGALPTRYSSVSTGESIIIIGDSTGRRPHSFDDGKLSDTNYTFSLMSIKYKHVENNDEATTRVHGLTGNSNRGDSGCAVMDAAGKVIGMLSATRGDLGLCLTMDEISKANEQILNTLRPRYVGCTARESALLGRVYWGEKSGKSIKEMNALATVMNARYFAVAHDGTEAHAFTFHVLWWEIFSENYMIEDLSQCLCEPGSFIDHDNVKYTKEGKVMCGCAENSCRNNKFYHRRTGEDNDRRWAIYETMNSEKSGHYVPSKESLASMENIAREINYWRNKATILEGDMEKLASEHTFYYRVVIAVIFCVGSSIVIWLYQRWQNTARMLKKANTECEELKQKQLSQPQEASEATNLHTPGVTTS